MALAVILILERQLFRIDDIIPTELPKHYGSYHEFVSEIYDEW